MKKLVIVLILSLCCLFLTPALASASTPTLKSLAKSVAALQKKVKRQATSIASLKSDLASAKQTISAQGTTLTSQAATIATLQTTVSGQATTLTNAAPVLAIAPYVSLHTETMNGVAGPNIVFEGCNVHVRSANEEGETTGLGNLIVGWDTQPAPMPPPWRTGSNNLVVGSGNNFTSYGCFIAGGSNVVSGAYSSVTGGQVNQATGSITSVAGGYNNVAANTGDTIGGGQNITLNVGYAWQAGTYHTP